MAEPPIEYKSEVKAITVRSRILDISEVGGINCKWNGAVTNRMTTISMDWEFDWKQLIDTGIDGLIGNISVFMSGAHDEFCNVNVNLSDSPQIITKIINVEHHWQESYWMYFRYSLRPTRTLNQKYDQMFQDTELTNGILLVGGKEVHVNKEFLSFHSEFFHRLFNTQLMEGQMEVIPVEDISYLEFGRLLGCIYPDTEFPSDKTCIKLAEHGHRFLMKSVLNHVEHHLLHNSELENDLKIALADAYGMEKLMGQMILELDDLEKAKKLKESPDYTGLSDKTKGKILDKIMLII